MDEGWDIPFEDVRRDIVAILVGDDEASRSGAGIENATTGTHAVDGNLADLAAADVTHEIVTTHAAQLKAYHDALDGARIGAAVMEWNAANVLVRMTHALQLASASDAGNGAGSGEGGGGGDGGGDGGGEGSVGSSLAEALNRRRVAHEALCAAARDWVRSPSSQRREACAGAETHTLALQAVATRSQQLRHLRLLSRGYSGARNRTRARSLDAGGAADDDDDGGGATHKAVCVPLSWIHGNAEGGVTTAKDASARQAALDLERDVMSVNGTMHKGSDGYDAVLGAVVAAMASAEAGVIGTLEPPPATVLQDFARTVLQRGNRTVSGGDAYDAVMRLVVHPGTAIAVADSHKAEPVSIRVDFGAFQVDNAAGSAAADGDGDAAVSPVSAGQWEWGLRAHVEATTRYRVCDPDPDSEETATWAKLAATYSVRLGLPLQRRLEAAVAPVDGDAAATALLPMECGRDACVTLDIDVVV